MFEDKLLLSTGLKSKFLIFNNSAVMKYLIILYLNKMHFTNSYLAWFNHIK